MHNYCSWL